MATVWKRYLDERHWSFVSDSEVTKLARLVDNPKQLWTELHQNKYLRTDVAEYKVQDDQPAPERNISIL